MELFRVENDVAELVAGRENPITELMVFDEGDRVTSGALRPNETSAFPRRLTYAEEEAYYKTGLQLPWVRGWDLQRQKTYVVSKDSLRPVKKSFSWEDFTERFWAAHSPKNPAMNYLVRPSVGTDPEVFLENAHSHKFVPAFEVLPKDKRSGYSWFWDGFQAETTVEPRHCHEQLMDGLIFQIRDFFPPNHAIRRGSVIEVERKTLENLKREYVEFGCRPSLNAYGTRSQLDMAATDIPYRFAGGHLHYGLTGVSLASARFSYEEAIKQYVRAMDVLVGIPSVSMAENWDAPHVRRRWYGLAGEYRLPTYGFEYRTLSNFWLAHPALAYLVWDLARIGILYMPFGIRDRFEISDALVQAIINQENVEEARKFIKKHEKIYKELILARYGSRWGIEGKVSKDATEFSFQALLHPIEETFKLDRCSIRENWTKNIRWFDYARRY